MFSSVGGERLIRVFPYYLCVWNRLVTLPRDFVMDLATVGGIAFGFAFTVVSLLWTPPGKIEVKIEVTSATPDTTNAEFEYLPDNHPLRKLKLKESLNSETKLEEESKLSGFIANLKRLVLCIASFHWKFYDDILTCLKLGFGFLIYLVYPFPQDLYAYVVGNTSIRPVQGSAGDLVSWVMGMVSSVPRYGLYGVSWAADRVTQTVERVNMIVKKSQEGNENTPEGKDLVSKEPTLKEEKLEKNLKSQMKTEREGSQTIDYTVPKNPRTAGDHGEQEQRTANLLEKIDIDKNLRELGHTQLVKRVSWSRGV